MIRDDGMGISDEHPCPHFRAVLHHQGMRRGSGLGLAISQNIVERHGGTHRREFRSGREQRFKIVLPIDSQRPVTGDDGLHAAPGHMK